MSKLINRIPGLCLLISSLPGLALRTHLESLGKPRNSSSVLEALPGKLDIKRHSPSILYSKPLPPVAGAAVHPIVVSPLLLPLCESFL